MIRHENEQQGICLMIERIKNGDDNLRNELIEDYLPFIAKSVSQICKRSITKQDEELCIGMEAFAKAVDDFDLEKEASFFSFAQKVIQWKVIDYLRKESRYTDKVVYKEDFEDTVVLDSKSSLEEYEEQEFREEFENDVVELEKELKKYKITFMDLSKESPSHEDARDRMKNITKLLIEDVEISTYIKNKRRLPVNKILKKVDVNKKTIERNRKYIMGLFVVFSGEYKSISSYLKW